MIQVSKYTRQQRERASMLKGAIETSQLNLVMGEINCHICPVGDCYGIFNAELYEWRHVTVPTFGDAIGEAQEWHQELLEDFPGLDLPDNEVNLYELFTPETWPELFEPEF